jgi:hypothetical protein
LPQNPNIGRGITSGGSDPLTGRTTGSSSFMPSNGKPGDEVKF